MLRYTCLIIILYKANYTCELFEKCGTSLVCSDFAKTVHMKCVIPPVWNYSRIMNFLFSNQIADMRIISFHPAEISPQVR